MLDISLKSVNMFTASQELIDILKKNGFKNKSHQFIEQGSAFSCKEEYNPQKHKRVFGIGTGKRKLNLWIKRKMIFVSDGHFITEDLFSLTEKQLRSIIAYFKSEPHRQKRIKSICENKIENAADIIGNLHPDASFDNVFQRLYDEVKI